MSVRELIVFPLCFPVKLVILLYGSMALLSYLILIFLNYILHCSCFALFGIPAWQIVQVYIITMGFSPTLYC